MPVIIRGRRRSGRNAGAGYKRRDWLPVNKLGGATRHPAHLTEEQVAQRVRQQVEASLDPGGPILALGRQVVPVLFSPPSTSDDGERGEVAAWLHGFETAARLHVAVFELLPQKAKDWHMEQGRSTALGAFALYAHHKRLQMEKMAAAAGRAFNDDQWAYAAAKCPNLDWRLKSKMDSGYHQLLQRAGSTSCLDGQGQTPWTLQSWQRRSWSRSYTFRCRYSAMMGGSGFCRFKSWKNKFLMSSSTDPRRPTSSTLRGTGWSAPRARATGTPGRRWRRSCASA